jgi:hypothetical protein
MRQIVFKLGLLPKDKEDKERKKGKSKKKGGS